MRAHTVLAAALTVTVLFAGCGIADPYAARNTTTSTSIPAPAPTGTTPPNANPAPERGGTIPTATASSQDNLSSGAGQPTPQAALGRYARLYTNWNATTVAGVQRQLASISLDGARAQALQAAASYQRDTTLLASNVANAGTVISIATGQGDARGRWVIVTSETTTGRGDYTGLPATLHVPTPKSPTSRPDGSLPNGRHRHKSTPARRRRQCGDRTHRARRAARSDRPSGRQQHQAAPDADRQPE